MLTYPKGTSTGPLVSGGFRCRYAGMGLVQYPKKAQKAKGDFLDFFVREVPAEFLFINYLELLNGLVAELLWCCHAPSVPERRGEKRTVDLLDAACFGALAICHSLAVV